MDIGSYIKKKRERGVFTESSFDKYAPPSEPVVVDGQAKEVSPVSNSDFYKIAKPVMVSWLKGKGGLERVSKGGLWNTDKVGGVTANEYFKRGLAFDDPSLPMEQRLTNMIYGAETSGDKNAWKTVNKFGYMGRAQMGSDFMADYKIDKNRYMKDPRYQHESTVNAVKSRINELKGRYFRNGGSVVSNAKPHHGNSKKEDLLIVDPKDGSIYGGMRYDETVFSQKHSKGIDKLIEVGDDTKLGRFVRKARLSHTTTNAFYKGGTTEDPNKRITPKDKQQIRQKIGNLKSELKYVTARPNLAGQQNKILADIYTLEQELKQMELDSTLPKDANGNSYKRNSDGTFERAGMPGVKFSYNDKSRRFVMQKPAKSATSGAGGTSSGGGKASGGGSGSTGGGAGAPMETRDPVLEVQKYLNSFFLESAAKQKGFSKGSDGRIYDDTGKEVPVDKILGSEAKNERIDEDGKFGPETEAAIKIYNLANPDKKINYSQLPSGRLLLSSTDNPAMKEFFDNGSIKRYGVQTIEPLKPKGMPSTAATQPNPSIPVDAAAATSQNQISGSTGGSVFNRENLQRIGSNLADVAGAALLYRQANQTVPEYQQTSDWIEYGNRVKSKIDQGFNAAVQSEFQRNLSRNRMSGYGQITAAAGGGGTQGAVLGALGRVNQASADAASNFAVADQQQRDQNLATFGNFARAEEGTNLAMWQNQAEGVLQSSAQAAAAIPALRNQIEERNQTYNSYGPGSVYDQFIQSQIAAKNEEAKLAQTISSNYGAMFGSSLLTEAAIISERDKKLVRMYGKYFKGQ